MAIRAKPSRSKAKRPPEVRDSSDQRMRASPKISPQQPVRKRGGAERNHNALQAGTRQQSPRRELRAGDNRPVPKWAREPVTEQEFQSDVDAKTRSASTAATEAFARGSGGHQAPLTATEGTRSSIERNKRRDALVLPPEEVAMHREQKAFFEDAGVTPRPKRPRRKTS